MEACAARRAATLRGHLAAHQDAGLPYGRCPANIKAHGGHHVLTRGQRPRGAPSPARGARRPSRPDAQPLAARKNAKKNPCAARAVQGFEREVGGALLSRAPGRSIIAAGALNGRVRDGNGCLSPARATNQKDWAMRTSKMKESCMAPSLPAAA